MTQQTLARKREFKVALACLGLTATGFAAEQGVSTTHLYEVLNERRVPGAALNAAIDKLIAASRKSRAA